MGSQRPQRLWNNSIAVTSKIKPKNCVKTLIVFEISLCEIFASSLSGVRRTDGIITPLGFVLKGKADLKAGFRTTKINTNAYNSVSK